MAVDNQLLKKFFLIILLLQPLVGILKYTKFVYCVLQDMFKYVMCKESDSTSLDKVIY